MRAKQKYLSILTLVLASLGLFWSSAATAQKMFAPVHGYVSIETFEIRKEFVIRLDTIAERLELDLTKNNGVMSSQQRRQIEEKVGQWLTGKCPLAVDGRQLDMVLDRVHFVRPDPVKGMVVDERDEVNAGEALLGVVFAAALDGPVEKVSIQWQVFPADSPAAIVSIGTRQNKVTKKVSLGAATIEWQSKGELKVPKLLELPLPPPMEFTTIPLLSVLAGLSVLILIVVALRLADKTPAWLGVMVVVMLALTIIGRDWLKVQLPGKARSVSPELADEVVYSLLKNTYRAFDYRKESDVYDVLAKSVDGELLTKVYLEVQKSLQLESQGGARAKVYELDLRKCELGEREDNKVVGFNARCSWVAIGTVTHWGHTHDRVNRYEAQLKVELVGNQWKLRALDLLNQERSIRKRP